MPLRANRHVDTVVLDDEDDVIEINTPDEDSFLHKPKSNKFTSTPENEPPQRPYANGVSDDDDITFIREFKSPRDKHNEALRKGLNYIKPFSGRTANVAVLQNGTKPKMRPPVSKKPNNSRNSFGSSSLDYSIRLDDKLQYKRLLESVSGQNSPDEPSVYQTPVGRLFNYDTANRSARILANALKTSSTSPAASLSTPRERMSTKDTIRKVLDDFESEPVVVKDSDSDSDVIIVRPPSPKPDIKVEPVNSLRRVVDTAQQAKSEWLQGM
ncbi:hypothetical protein NQ318_020021 [Aromia moschata]|uniref:Uncharacterized protein n=1 Tax=Aromia moschata TaxID=1265417 RepID=A0AAV8ZBI0_9CUCU|nr:hypothetical protein NQ318_020021 [Aromia moschata]